MKISEVTEVTDQVLEALNLLLPQLSESATPMTERDLRSLIDSRSSQLLMAVENGAFVGSLTLVLFHLPTGLRARIEDLVVDRSARGKGIGKALIIRAVELARDFGAIAIDLTSNPNRTSANALYKSMGFALRQTNVYRYELKTLH
jgi:ribosomal protein S18 acetylase RimI-like enzyme